MCEGLKKLEDEAIRILLAGDDPVLDLLRRQYEVAHVAGREFSGMGFFANFIVPDETLSVLNGKNFAFGDVSAEIEGLQNGAGFVLHVQRGLLGFLEAFTYDEQWPGQITKFKLAYRGGKRDLEALRKR